MANKKVSQLTSKPSVLTTDLFPIADPSTGQLYKTTISDLGTAIGSGVSSVNGLVGAVVLDTDDIQELASPTNKWFTDTRARAALSASSPLAYNSGTGVFSIPAATSSQNGYLTSTDWSTFNGKLDPSTAASTYVPYTGATGAVNLGSNNITAGIAIVNQVKAAGSGGLSINSNNGTQIANLGGGGGANITFYGGLTGTSASFSGDVTLSGTNPRLYLTDTDNNPDYFISNTDGTFTVYDVTNSTSRFTIGTTGNATFTNAITGGGSITGQSIYSNGIVSVGTYLILPANNTVGGTNYYIGQQMAGSDYWRIFGNSVADDQGELVFSVGDNGLPLASNGQRFRFFYDASAGGTSKDALIIDYNVSTFATTISATGATLTGALSGTSATFSSSVTATTNLSVLASTNAGGNLKVFTSSSVPTQGSAFILAPFGNAILSHNILFDGSGYVYDQSGFGTSIRLSSGNANPGDIYFNTFTSGTAGASATENNKMIIKQNGNVGIGTTAPSQKLAVVGDIRGYKLIGGEAGVGAGNYTIFSNDDNVGYIDTVRAVNSGDFHFRFDGTSRAYINRSTGVYVATSDINKKKDFEDSNIGLAEVLQLKPILYRMESDESNGQKELGFIAQEVHGIIPSAYQESGDFIGLNFNPIVAALTKAVQELKAELDILKNK